MEDNRWFDEVREAYSIGWIRADPIDGFTGGRPLRPVEIEYGCRLGLLDSPSFPGCRQESHGSDSFPPADEARARMLWFRYVLAALADWWETNGDPQYELSEVLSPWRQEAGRAWDRLRPRGLDRVYFGSSARSRLIDRLRAFARDSDDVS